MHNAWLLGRYEEAININQKLSKLNHLLFLESNPIPIKFAASILGICEYEIRLPLSKISEKNGVKLKEEMDNLSLSFS